MLRPEIMTVEDVAELIKVSERTIYEWAQKGKIPCGKLGSTWRFKRSEIEKWIDERIGRHIETTQPNSDTENTVLNPDHILLMDCDSKIEAINNLSFCLAESLQNVDPYELSASILKRESLMSTGIGMGIGVPHVRLPSIKTVKMAIGIVPKGISDYESIDDEAITLIFMIVAGENQQAQYLKLLAKVSAHLKDENFRNSLLTTVDKNAAHKLISGIIG